MNFGDKKTIAPPLKVKWSPPYTILVSCLMKIFKKEKPKMLQFLDL